MLWFVPFITYTSDYGGVNFSGFSICPNQAFQPELFLLQLQLLRLLFKKLMNLERRVERELNIASDID